MSRGTGLYAAALKEAGDILRSKTPHPYLYHVEELTTLAASIVRKTLDKIEFEDFDDFDDELEEEYRNG